MLIDGEPTTDSFEKVISGASKDLTIELKDNITVDAHSINSGLHKISVIGNDYTITLSESNTQIVGQFDIKHVTINPAEGSNVLFGWTSLDETDAFTLEKVTVTGKAIVYGMPEFEAYNCTFQQRLQLSFGQGSHYTIQGTTVKDLQINPSDKNETGYVEKTVISSEQKGAHITIDDKSPIHKLSVCDSDVVQLQDCSMIVGEIGKHDDAKTPSLVVGEDVAIQALSDEGMKIQEGMNVIITNNSTLEIPLIVLEGDLEMKKGAKLLATLQNIEEIDGKKTTSTFSSSSGIIADSDLIFSKGSIVMSGSIIPADGNGTITVSGEAVVKGNTVVKNLIVLDGATLTVPTDATLTTTGDSTINGELDVKGAVQNTGKMTINAEVTGANKITNGTDATMVITPDATLDSEITGATGGYVDEDNKSLGLKNYLENDLTISNKAFLADDLTINKGVTLTIASKGDLNLNGHSLILEGNLVIANGGSITAFFSKDAGIDVISIKETGSITNNGIIGKGDNEVTVISGQDATNGKVIIRNVVGVEFSLTKIVDKASSSTTYKLTVSGTVTRNGSDYALGIDGAYITDLEIKDLEKNVLISGSDVTKNGSIDIGSKAVVTVSGLTLQTGVTMTIDGKLVAESDKKVSMWNGALVTVNGNTENVIFSAKTGGFSTYTDGKRTDVEELPEAQISNSTISLLNLNGLTIEVTSRSYTADDDGNTPMTEQMLNIYGTASFAKDGKERFNNGSITATGKIYVQGDKELILSKDMTFEGEGTFVTLGTIKAVDEEVVSYIGSSYSVKSTTDSSVTYIYTTFDNAYAAIAGADDQKVTVKGGYTFTKEYTVAADQTIEFEDGAEYKISKDGKIIVANDGTLSEGFATSGIQGVLVVMDEGDCTPVSGSYEVRSVDVDGTVTYSGAAWAIGNSKAGDVIDIVGTVKFPEKVTVPAGVTIDIKKGATVTADGGMVVNGKVLNGGEIEVAAKKNLEVSGTVDNTINTESKITTPELTVTGTFIGNATATKINAAQYTNEDAENIYTSVAEAVKASSAMDIPADIIILGKFTEGADITLGEDMIITIETDADITLNSIRLSVGSTLTVNGKLTADVIGAVGKDDTTGAVSDAVIDLSKTKNVVFKLTYSESDATSTLTLTIDAGYAGAVKVEKGAVAVNTEAMVLCASDATFAIGSDAVVNLGASTITNKDKAFTNEGTLNINENVTFIGVLGGDVVVKAGKTITLKTTEDVPADIEAETEAIEDVSTIVVGTITLSEKDGAFASAKIVGEVLIGTAPETLGASGAVSGKVTFEDNAYVVVFEGSTFASTENGVKSTSYTVNGIAFAKIYTSSDAVKVNVIDDYVEALDDLDVTGTITWTSNGESVGSNAKVVSIEAVETFIKYETADVVVSEGPGLQVYIDDIRTDGSEELAIGTHTITVYLLPNYEGTPIVTINGTTTTDGTFEITTDMINGQNKIVVTGATYVEPSTPSIVIPSQPAESDDDMGLTEYLLIVLVILAAILVIVVAIRMMRS